MLTDLAHHLGVQRVALHLRRGKMVQHSESILKYVVTTPTEQVVTSEAAKGLRALTEAPPAEPLHTNEQLQGELKASPKEKPKRGRPVGSGSSPSTQHQLNTLHAQVAELQNQMAKLKEHLPIDVD